MAEQIVKNNSKAYGYNYASLADIVKQGFKIPKMTTRMIEGQIFVFWYDEETKEWLQGAPLIVPEMRGKNAAQAMGSALTYARRYTAQMAFGLACDDDAKLERQEARQTGRTYQTAASKVDFDEIRKKIASIGTQSGLVTYWNSLGLSSKQVKILQPDFAKRREEIKQAEGGQDGVDG